MDGLTGNDAGGDAMVGTETGAETGHLNIRRRCWQRQEERPEETRNQAQAPKELKRPAAQICDRLFALSELADRFQSYRTESGIAKIWENADG